MPVQQDRWLARIASVLTYLGFIAIASVGILICAMMMTGV
jgi:hypothetical protein